MLSLSNSLSFAWEQASHAERILRAANLAWSSIACSELGVPLPGPVKDRAGDLYPVVTLWPAGPGDTVATSVILVTVHIGGPSGKEVLTYEALVPSGRAEKWLRLNSTDR